MNLDLRHKLTKGLIRLFLKKKKKSSRSTQPNPTQLEAERFKFYRVEGNCGFYWIEIFTGQTCWIDLKK